MVWLSKTAQQGVDTAFFTGIANLSKRLVIMLSPEAVLSSAENEELADISVDLLVAG